MGNDNPTFWGIHAGRTGDADVLFLQKNCIGLGWELFPDLSKLENNRETFKEVYARTYPDAKQGSIPVNAGQLFRFAYEMRVDDVVVYPSKHDKLLYIGLVKTQYEYAPSRNRDYPHQRGVKWLEKFPRTRFSQGALYEIGSAMSLFQVKNYADEFIAALKGQLPTVEDASEDVTVGLVADEIQQTTRDFILKRLEQELKGHPFAHFVAHLLEKMGYQTRIAPEGPDGGIDIIAHRDELGFEPPIIKAQVKSTTGNIGAPDVQALYGNIGSKDEYGLFVTLGGFTAQAKSFALGKSNLRLIDGDELVEMVLRYYESFNSRYKGLIPLQNVYIPQSLDEGSD